MRDITARARIELNPPGDPKGRLKKLYLRQLRIEHPSATGIKVILPGTGSITLNKTQPALLGPISLEAPAGAPGFEIKPDKTGKGFDLRGKFLLEGFNLPWVEADITGHLKGNADVRAGNLTIDFLGADGLDLDLRDPRIEAIKATLGSEKERLWLMNPAAPLGAQEWGISSKGVRFRQRTKESGKEEKQLHRRGRRADRALLRQRGLGPARARHRARRSRATSTSTCSPAAARSPTSRSTTPCSTSTSPSCRRARRAARPPRCSTSSRAGTS